MSAAAGPRAVLIGPPGAGKTTVGRVLAERWETTFADTDQLIEEETGRTIPEIFVDDGEPRFRELELETVRRALGERTGVLALGGGAPMQVEAQEALVGQRVVFLDVAIADAAGRVGFDRSRPLLAVNPRAQWTRLMQERRPTYERLATLRVDTAGRSPEQVAEDIVEALERSDG